MDDSESLNDARVYDELQVDDRMTGQLRRMTANLLAWRASLPGCAGSRRNSLTGSAVERCLREQRAEGAWEGAWSRTGVRAPSWVSVTGDLSENLFGANVNPPPHPPCT